MGENENNFDESLKLLKEAANEGFPKAKALLGVYYMRNYICSNYVKKGEVKQLIEEARKKGDPFAEGYAYFYGIGELIDKTKALENSKKAASAGDSNGIWLLGKCLTQTFKKISKHTRIKQMHLFKLATMGGCSYALYDLAKCFKSGKALETKGNHAQYVRMIKHLANNGNSTAMHDLGMLYFKSISELKRRETDVTVKAKNPVHWFTKAAEAGMNCNSMYHLGQCFEKGIGVSKDPEKAKYYIEEAKKFDPRNSNTCKELKGLWPKP